MKKTTLTVVALGLALMFACPFGSAQNRRTSGAAQTTNQTTTQTTQSRTENQTTTRQSATTPSRQTTTTTTTTTTAPGGRRNSTTAQTPAATQTTTTTTKQNAQPQKPASQPSSQPTAQPSSKPSSQPSQPAQTTQPSGRQNNNGTTMRPGGSTTHQNSNGNVTKPTGKAPTTGQPQNVKPQSNKPQNPQQKPENVTKGGKNVTPGYKPDALKVKPPKQPEFHHNSRKNEPKAFFEMGYHMYGNRINTLPKGHTIRYVNKMKYYYYNGVFYRHNTLSGYVISRPPKGYSFDPYSVNICPIPVLLDPYRDQATRIAEASGLARLYANLYPSYRPYDDEFYINNVMSSSFYHYYYNDGTYFAEMNGRLSVVDAPLGALTDRLPYDYEEVYLGSDLFYLVDNILYGVVCPEGTPYFEVFCVL